MYPKVDGLGRGEGEGQFRSGSRQAQVGFNLVFRDPTVLALVLLWALALSAAWIGYFFLERSDASVARPADQVWGYIAWALTALTISLFFSLATAHAADAAIDRRRSLPETLRATVAQLPALAGWFVLLAMAWIAIGVGLTQIDTGTRVPAWLLASLVMGTATFFVIPALAVDSLGPLAAIRVGLEPLRRRWLAALTGLIGIGIIVFVLSIPATLLAKAASHSHRLGHDSWEPQLFAAACLLMLAFAIGLAARESFALILYRDAIGDLPGEPRAARESGGTGWKIVAAIALIVVGLAVFGAVRGSHRNSSDGAAAASPTATPRAAGVFVVTISDPRANLLLRGAPVTLGSKRFGSVQVTRLSDPTDVDSPVVVTARVDPPELAAILEHSELTVAERGGSPYLRLPGPVTFNLPGS